MKTTLVKFVIGGLLLSIAPAGSAVAQTNGTWTNPLGGTWSVTSNWAGGAVAAGTGAIADFSTLDITANRDVFLDQNVTLGTLLAGDTAGSSRWAFRASPGTATLTFSTTAGQPVIRVPNADARLILRSNLPTDSLTLAGTQGLVKEGLGDLYIDQASATGVTGGLWIKEGSVSAYTNNVPSGTITLGDGITTVALRNEPTKTALNVSNAITVNAGEQTITQRANNTGGGIAGAISGVGSLLLLPTTDAGGSGQANFGNSASTYAGGTRIGAVGANISVSALLASSSTNAQGAVTQGPYGTGTVTLDGGGLMAQGASRTLHNAIVVQQNAVLGDGNTAANTRNLTLAGPMTLSGGDRALEIRIGRTGGAGNVTINGVIGDGGNGYGLTIRSGGTVSAANDVLVLGGVNTYTGDTVVESGVLRLANASAITASPLVRVNGVLDVAGLGGGGWTVASGQTLSGTGSVTGVVNVSGIVAPGNSIGTLTITNDLTWNAGEAWVFELGTAGPSLASPGTSDFLDITGAGSDFLKGAGSGFTFDFAGTGEEGWYRLARWAGTTTFAASDFTATNLAPSATADFSISGNALYLQVAVVPEPSSLALAGVGLAAALRVFRRRRAR